MTDVCVANMIFIFLLFASRSVNSVLIPGANVNFVTKAGYKYTGVPEVYTKTQIKPLLNSFFRLENSHS